MSIIAALLVAVVAAEHGYILVMEMFLWRTARVQAIFGVTPEFAESTVALAANQGLYNGFLAAGLLWSLVSAPHGFALKVFFSAAPSWRASMAARPSRPAFSGCRRCPPPSRSPRR